jgi:alpha,alpha-trehalose phosphorylase
MTDIKNNQDVFHPWKISEPVPRSDNLRETAHYASLFSLGNGYMGLRASHEDVRPEDPFAAGADDQTGTFLNGFYESADIQYGEIAYGYAKESQTLHNIIETVQ